MIAYIIRLRPFSSELQQVIWASDEFTIFFGMIIMFLMYRSADDVELRKRYGLILIAIIILSIIKNMSIIIIIAVRNNYIKLRTWVHKKINHDEMKCLRLAKEHEEIIRKEEEQKQNEIIMSRWEMHKKESKPASVNSRFKNQNAIMYDLLPMWF